MKKKIIIITTLIIIILLILIIVLGIYKKSSNSINNIIIESKYGFELERTITKGTTVNGYTHKADCYYYKSDDIAIFVYDYDDEESAQKEMEVLKEERQKETSEIEYLDQETHIELSLCHEDTCIKNITFDNYLISFHYTNAKKYIAQTEEIIKSLLEISEKYVR